MVMWIIGIGFHQPAAGHRCRSLLKLNEGDDPYWVTINQ